MLTERENVRKILGESDSVYGDHLYDSFGPDEHLITVTVGVVEGSWMGKEVNTAGTLFLTNDRIIKATLKALSMAISEMDSIPLEMISSVDETTMMFGVVRVQVTASNTGFVATGRALKGFAGSINKARRERKNIAPAPVQVAHDPLEQLQKLGALLEQGLISQTEFDEKKRSLLDKI